MWKPTLLSVLLSSPALAQVYTGTVGPYPVVMQLEKDFTGKYAYLSKGLSIELKGQKKSTLTLQEQVFDGETGRFKTTGTFQLSPIGTGYTGTWKAPGSPNALKVQLKPVSRTLKTPLAMSAGLQKLFHEDLYTFTVLNHPWTVLKNGWVEEPLSKVKYPRVTNAPKLNLALQDLQLQEAAHALDCLSMGAGFGGNQSWESTVKVTHQTRNIYSLQASQYMYCGGAHPSYSSEGHVLDRMTGKPVSLASLWDKLTRKKQRELYLKGYPRDADPQCLEVIEGDPDGQLSWTLTPEGLLLWPNFLPHVVTACAEEVLVPYAQLKTHQKVGSVYLQGL